MKTIKIIALAAVVTLGVFFAAVFNACSKDECGAITCFNKGTCRSGTCICRKGTGGFDCKTIYSALYSAQYKGLSPDDPQSDTTNIIYLTSEGDSTNFDLMRLTWIDTTGTVKVQFPVELTNNTASGSNFTVTPTTQGIYAYSGSGSVNSNQLSLVLREVDTAGVVVMRNFSNYFRQ